MSNIIYLARYFHMRRKPGIFSIIPTFEVIDINKNKDDRKGRNEEILRKNKLGKYKNETTTSNTRR